MIHRFLMALLLLFTLTGSAVAVRASSAQAQAPGFQSHLEWVVQSLIRMQTIKTGMTRGELLKVFTTEGGLSTPVQRTFVSRDCPYFKVDVVFETVGRPGRDSDGRVTLQEEDQRDIIVKIFQALSRIRQHGLRGSLPRFRSWPAPDLLKNIGGKSRTSIPD